VPGTPLLSSGPAMSRGFGIAHTLLVERVLAEYADRKASGCHFISKQSRSTSAVTSAGTAIARPATAAHSGHDRASASAQHAHHTARLQSDKEWRELQAHEERQKLDHSRREIFCAGTSLQSPRPPKGSISRPGTARHRPASPPSSYTRAAASPEWSIARKMSTRPYSSPPSQQQQQQPRSPAPMDHKSRDDYLSRDPYDDGKSARPASPARPWSPSADAQQQAIDHNKALTLQLQFTVASHPTERKRQLARLALGSVTALVSPEEHRLQHKLDLIRQSEVMTSIVSARIACVLCVELLDAKPTYLPQPPQPIHTAPKCCLYLCACCAGGISGAQSHHIPASSTLSECQ